ncbi:hypothetical protein [Streptomyces sp. NPDC048643]|uniref:hypothetical protein n=1 Tax=Streptomyces sp. NPDC048643 TaxID=3155637 RepID=UPI0034408774
MDEPPTAAGALIRELEGHLLIAAARAEGHDEAVRFAGSLAWLTDSQRAEVEARFEEAHLALARLSWEHTVRRAGEVRAEYEARYRTLCRRWCAAALVGAVLVLAALALTTVPGG